MRAHVAYLALLGAAREWGPGGPSDGLDWHKGSMERVADCWEMPASLSPVWNQSQQSDVGT